MRVEKDFVIDGDRYAYDMLLKNKHGWAQLDTDEDAYYFGNWVNPPGKKTVSYTEGDVVITRCESDEEFVTHLRDVFATYNRLGYRPRIDPGTNPAVEIELQRLGLLDLLHAHE